MKTENKEENMYLFLPNDLRFVVFDLESEMGVAVGSGKMFRSRTGQGRTLSGEDSLIRMASLHIGNKYLNYSDSFLAEKFSSSVSLIHYSNKAIRNLLEANPRFRKKIFNVAIQNGIIDLANEIEEISGKREETKKAFR